jgi:hypothetical protein
MSFPRRIHLYHVLLVVFATDVASNVAAAQQAAAAPPPAPSAGIVQPTPVAGNAPRAVSRARGSSVSLYDSLVGDAAGRTSLTEPVLVVPGKPMDAQAIDQIVEDLSIMSRIIEKNALGDDYTPGGLEAMELLSTYRASPWNSVGPVTFFPVAGRAKPMYLGGYGAIFFIQVHYPLLPPPETPQEQPAGQQEDPIWAEAKRSVLEPQAQPMLPQEEGEPAEPYSREKVDTLRGNLIATMKHATNIRALAPTEWVTIVVQGPGTATAQGGPTSPSGPTAIPAPAQPADRTVLTLRATRADADLYAKGQLNQQQFEQRLQIITR